MSFCKPTLKGWAEEPGTGRAPQTPQRDELRRIKAWGVCSWHRAAGLEGTADLSQLPWMRRLENVSDSREEVTGWQCLVPLG